MSTSASPSHGGAHDGPLGSQGGQTGRGGAGAPEEADHVLVIGPDGQPVAVPAHLADGADGADAEEEGGERNVAALVEQPAKVMRIGRMVQQLLEEVKSAPLDEPGRTRLAQVVHTSIQELKDGLAPELDEELDRLIQPFDQGTPSESELRIAQAQLVGWLEGLFHGIQTAIYAQQMAARGQLEQMRRALPPGAVGPGPGGPGQPEQDDDQQHGPNGMYL
ncbi:MAG: bacterial proteasome activator family protein [Marmoricola sp.]|nr:bacterial proteasome activator family protein [Marmoricola sp.]